VQANGGISFDEQVFFERIEHKGNFAILDRINRDMHRKYKDRPSVICSEIVAGDTYEANERRGKQVLSNL
jgi:hypothetical protein